MPKYVIDLYARHRRSTPLDFDVAVVTGARGFIGSRLVAVLREVFLTPVVAFDLEGWPEMPEDEHFVKIRGSARELDDIDGALNEAEDLLYYEAEDLLDHMKLYFKKKNPRLAVFHLAAFSSNNPRLTREQMDLNARVPSRIYTELCDRFPEPSFIFASSFGVYGQSAAGSYVTEGHHCYLRPMTDYGRSKLLAENAIETESFAFSPGTRASAYLLRLSNVIGCGGVSKGGFPLSGPSGGVVRALYEACRDKKPLRIPVPVGGLLAATSPCRDFVHVDDVVRAMILAAEKRSDTVTTLNICSGLATPIERLPELAGIDYVRDLPYNAASDALYSRGSYTKASNEIDWNPRVNLGEAIAEIVEAASREREA